MKNQYIGGNCLKKGAWTVCRFKGGGGLGEKEGVVFVFEGGLTPVHTMLSSAPKHFNFRIYCVYSRVQTFHLQLLYNDNINPKVF